jgi:small conductance mechanosensitive channel
MQTDGTGTGLDGWMDALVVTAGDWVARIILAVVILLIGRYVARLVRSLVVRGMERGKMDVTLRGFLSKILYWIMLVLVGIAVLGTLGIEVLSFVAILGAAGLAVGLAFQGTLSNFASGVMLLLFRPLSVGDAVSVGGNSGVVRDIGLFTLEMDTFDGVRMIVPNSKVYGETITNYSTNPTRRIDLVAGVSYDDDLEVAGEVLRRMVASDSRILPEPEPMVAVTELADSSVNFTIRVWTTAEDFWQTNWDLTRRIKDDLEAAGCSIPYPQRDLHLFDVGDDQEPGGGPGEGTSEETPDREPTRRSDAA